MFPDITCFVPRWNEAYAHKTGGICKKDSNKVYYPYFQMSNFLLTIEHVE